MDALLVPLWLWLLAPLGLGPNPALSRLESLLLVEVTVGLGFTLYAVQVARRKRQSWLAAGENGYGLLLATGLVRRQFERLTRLLVWLVIALAAAAQVPAGARPTTGAITFSGLLLTAIATDCLGAVLDFREERALGQYRRAEAQRRAQEQRVNDQEHAALMQEVAALAQQVRALRSMVGRRAAEA